jgi:broad specificity phosphatase PhoE
MTIKRRAVLASAAALALPRLHAAVAPADVLILRHAATEPGIGDPAGFVLGRCETQRNLSDEGRAQAAAFGRGLGARGWRPAAIRCSRWCRCLDTGRGIAAALGPGAPAVEPWPALDSFFDDRAREPAQTAQLLERLRTLPRGRGFEIWVTHQVNISALTGVAPAMGEALWLVPGDGARVTTLRFAS